MFRVLYCFIFLFLVRACWSLSSGPTRVVVVGDVHDQWVSTVDMKALKELKPDLVLFTGDFGNENVELVREIVSNLDMPSAVILGNHDCWWSGQLAMRGYQYSDASVEEQKKLLGDIDVGFSRRDFPSLKLSVVGARPFSLGGGDDMFGKEHLAKFYGVSDMKSSTQRIKESILGAPNDHAVIVLGHNGPTGLGSQKNDICGADFRPEGGDSGDPDLEKALKETAGQRNIPLVVFGHMHHNLLHGQGLRKMVANDDKTVYLNAAVVPRLAQGKDETIQSEFAVVDLVDGNVESIKETWIGFNAKTTTTTEKVLYQLLEKDEL